MSSNISRAASEFVFLSLFIRFSTASTISVRRSLAVSSLLGPSISSIATFAKSAPIEARESLFAIVSRAINAVTSFSFGDAKSERANSQAERAASATSSSSSAMNGVNSTSVSSPNHPSASTSAARISALVVDDAVSSRFRRASRSSASMALSIPSRYFLSAGDKSVLSSVDIRGAFVCAGRLTVRLLGVVVCFVAISFDAILSFGSSLCSSWPLVISLVPELSHKQTNTRSEATPATANNVVLFMCLFASILIHCLR